MRPIFAAAILLSFAVPACRAQSAPDVGALTPGELNSLAANCPDISRVVASGAVEAYGEIFRAPLLVTTDLGRILIDGVQVVPRRLAPANFQAENVADRLHAQFYVDEGRKDREASARVERGLSDAKAAGEIDDFTVWKRRGRVAAFLVKAGAGQARDYLDDLPRPLLEKDRFILSALFREYRLKAEAEGKESALPWLKARLDELKNAGMLDRVGWEPERETAKLRFAGEDAAQDYAFGEDLSPFGVAYANHWKARRKESEAAVRRVVGRLQAGGLLVYSFTFEKARPADEAALRALEGLRAGADPAANLELARRRLGLTAGETRELAADMR
ncbi:MAG TPA: hypothetical protein VH309_05775 [Elusimicrobiota bacterium]|nr:hypothetical protein [Elusimicrobiota bacterium]